LTVHCLALSVNSTENFWQNVTQKKYAKWTRQSSNSIISIIVIIDSLINRLIDYNLLVLAALMHKLSDDGSASDNSGNSKSQ